MYMEQPKQPSLGQSLGSGLCSNSAIQQRSKEVPYALSEPQPDSKPDCSGGSCEVSRMVNEMTLRVKVMTKDVIMVRNALEI